MNIGDRTDQKEEKKFPRKLAYWGGLGLVVLFLVLLFVTVSTDLRCERSASGVECGLIQNTTLLKMQEIKILDPIAVDVTTHRRKKYSTASYSAEIRSSHISYTVPLLTSYSYEVAQSAANEVNKFLLSSQEPLFSKRFRGIRLPFIS